MRANGIKKTLFLCDGPVNFQPLARDCDGCHTHAPWAVNRVGGGVSFFTAEERNYPELLCSRISALVARQFAVQPLPKPSQEHKAAGGLQPRRGHKPVVNEFHSILTLQSPVQSRPNEPCTVEGRVFSPMATKSSVLHRLEVLTD